MGLVFLRDLRVQTLIGVGEHERREMRHVLVNLELETDLEPSAASDDLRDSVDYAAIASRVRDHASTSRFRLLEALAGSIATLVLDGFPLVRAVTVRVEKPGAVAEVRTVGVEVRRERE